ncbi:MAG: hypothetical protein HC801_06295 [Nitrospira sp.]|nr:hypothetical protein [Nitrospira sp.]
MENRVLIPELKKMGVPITSHSSTLDDEIVQKVSAKLASKIKGAVVGNRRRSPFKISSRRHPRKRDGDQRTFGGGVS